jgi:hypothetical protein
LRKLASRDLVLGGAGAVGVGGPAFGRAWPPMAPTKRTTGSSGGLIAAS